jgi:hypothetical protein
MPSAFTSATVADCCLLALALLTRTHIMQTVNSTALAGTRYGDLSVSYADCTGRRIACRCPCTKLIFVNIDDLRSRAVTSCGCSRPSPEHRMQTREMAIARQRTIDFNIARAR